MRLRELVNSILGSTACSSSIGDNCAKRIYNGDRLLWSTDFYELTYYPKLVTNEGMEKGKLYAILTNPVNSLCLNNDPNVLNTCSNYTFGDYGEVTFTSPQFIMRAQASTRNLSTAFGLYEIGERLCKASTGNNVWMRQGEIFIENNVTYKLVGSNPNIVVQFWNYQSTDTRFAVYELLLVPRTRYYIEPATEIELGADYCFIAGNKAISSQSTPISGVDPGIFFNSYQDVVDYKICPDGSILFTETHTPLIMRGSMITEGGLIDLNWSVYSNRLISGFSKGTSHVEITNESYMYSSGSPIYYLSYDENLKVRFGSSGEKFKIYKLIPVTQ